MLILMLQTFSFSKGKCVEISCLSNSRWRPTEIYIIYILEFVYDYPPLLDWHQDLPLF